MRIAFLSVFYPFRGGIAQFNARLLRELERQHELMAINFTTQYPSLLFPGKTQLVTEADPADAVHSVRMLSSVNPFTWAHTAHYIAAWKPDVLLTSYWMPFFGPSMGTVAHKLQRQGIKHIAIMHNVAPHEPTLPDRIFGKRFIKHVDDFITLTHTVKNQLLSEQPSAHVHVLPHPLYDHFGEPLDKTSARNQLGLDAQRKTLLFFGLIRPYKGLDELITAMSLLPDDYQLLIAGECYENELKYTQLIEGSPARERIVFMNRYVPDAEVPLLFSATDALVLPYRSGTQSGAAAAAYHFGIPVVATRAGGLAEMVRDGQTGVLVASSRAELLAEGIRNLFMQNSKANYTQHIAALKEEWSWAGFAKKLTAIARG